MAEFCDVMRELDRLCGAHKTCDSTCAVLVAASQHGVTCRDYIFKYPKLAERDILEWSEANPPKRFPTYIEYLEKVFPSSRLSQVVCYRAVLFGENRSDSECPGQCRTCLNAAMSEETAAKMGVNPIECRR